MSSKTYNRPLGHLRRITVLLVLVVLLIVARPVPGDVSLGFLLMAVGEGLRLWAAGHLRKTVDLVTSGPYRFTRNPLYLGRLLIFTGLGVMCRLPHGLHAVVLVVGWAIFFYYYLPRKERVEPARLRRQHGAAYDKYHAAVPALFPSRSAYVDADRAPWSSERLLRNREHWMAIAVVAAGLWMLWRAYNP
ncbi:MAG: isoprenylcysteine carboxylmethyltransferase family protein [Acidobacteriota bacterium]|nr:isoprenylcysteine carboxylmethyltransferase family protein [Acidobacteriota bacterium]MDH3786902.1 isoprenylcysteine carboxylmethyltransferase family protein [Acidobacteriota bacterium]